MLENADQKVAHQYELLNILDNKAAALLTFNAIALASISIWLSYVPLNVMHLSLDAIFIALLVSTAVLLLIIWIRWSTGSETDSSLDRVRLSRTKLYRLAWRLSIASVVCLIIVSVIHIVGTTLVVFGLCGDVCQVFYSEAVFGNLDYRG